MVERGESGDVGSLRELLRRRSARILVPLLLTLLVVILTGALFGSIGLGAAKQGVVDASIIIPGAVGLSLLYGIRKFANFAQGDLMTLGAYVAFYLNFQLGLDLVWGFIAAPIILAAVGILLEFLIFSKLEGRGPISPLVASIGLSLVLQSAVAVIWGANLGSYRFPVLSDWILPGGVPLNPVKGFLTIVLSAAFMIVIHVLLSYTTLGKAMRATADNMELARTTGINARRVILWTWVVSAALAGLGGIIIGLAYRLSPTMGFDFILPIFAAVILGGIGSPYGAMLGGLVIGLATQLSVPYLAWLDSQHLLYNGVNYAPAVAFIIMVLVLLLRPEGILGVRRERGGTGAARWLRSRLVGLRTRRQPEGPEDAKGG